MKHLILAGGVWGQRFCPQWGGHGGGTLRVRQFNGAFIPGEPNGAFVLGFPQDTHLRNTHLLLAGNRQDEVFAAPGTCVRVNEDRTALTTSAS